jgi:hypothetical protein
MGAGPTQNQVYGYVYRQLHKIQEDLAKKGVVSTYHNRNLTGWVGTKEGTLNPVFTINHVRHNASNGECFLEFRISITFCSGGLERYSDVPNNNTWKKGIDRIVELFGGNNGPTQ